MGGRTSARMRFLLLLSTILGLAWRNKKKEEKRMSRCCIRCAKARGRKAAEICLTLRVVVGCRKADLPALFGMESVACLQDA